MLKFYLSKLNTYKGSQNIYFSFICNTGHEQTWGPYLMKLKTLLLMPGPP